jgi:predicted transcriptional regulator
MEQEKNKPKEQMAMVGVKVSPAVKDALRALATEDDRPIGYILRKLIEESPRVKQKLPQSEAASA